MNWPVACTSASTPKALLPPWPEAPSSSVAPVDVHGGLSCPECATNAHAKFPQGSVSPGSGTEPSGGTGSPPPEGQSLARYLQVVTVSSEAFFEI